MTTKNGTSYLFVYATVFCLVLGTIWSLAISKRGLLLDPEYGMWEAKVHMIENNCYNDQLIILGDSRLMASYIPSVLGDNVVNLALGGASPIETYYVVKKIIQHCHKLPSKIILGMSPFHLMTSEVFWGRAIRFGFFSFSETEEVRAESIKIKDYSLFPDSAPLKLKSLSSRLDARIRMFFDEALFPSSYFGSLRVSIRDWIHNGGRYAEGRKFYTEVLRDKGYHHYGLKAPIDKPAQEGHFLTFTESQIIKIYMDKLLTLLEENGTEVFYVQTPYSEKSDEAITAAFRDQTKIYLDAMAQKHKNLHVIGDLFPIRPNEDFGDVAHLNIEGAIKWSQYMKPFFAQLGAKFNL